MDIITMLLGIFCCIYGFVQQDECLNRVSLMLNLVRAFSILQFLSLFRMLMMIFFFMLGPNIVKRYLASHPNSRYDAPTLTKSFK